MKTTLEFNKYLIKKQNRLIIICTLVALITPLFFMLVPSNQTTLVARIWFTVLSFIIVGAGALFISGVHDIPVMRKHDEYLSFPDWKLIQISSLSSDLPEKRLAKKAILVKKEYGKYLLRKSEKQMVDELLKGNSGK